MASQVDEHSRNRACIPQSHSITADPSFNRVPKPCPGCEPSLWSPTKGFGLCHFRGLEVGGVGAVEGHGWHVVGRGVGEEGSGGAREGRDAGPAGGVQLHGAGTHHLRAYTEAVQVHRRLYVAFASSSRFTIVIQARRGWAAASLGLVVQYPIGGCGTQPPHHSAGQACERGAGGSAEK